MFERFTDRARRVIVLAQEEARMLNHHYIGTEHLLLGLLKESGGVAGRVLASLGITLEAVRQEVEAIVGIGQESPSGNVPFTPRAKKVLELSLREALDISHSYIGTEHLLLALVRDGAGAGVDALLKLGTDRDTVRNKVFEVLGKTPNGELPEADQSERADYIPEPNLREWLEAECARLRRKLVSIEQELAKKEVQLSRLCSDPNCGRVMSPEGDDILVCKRCGSTKSSAPVA